MKRTTIFTLGAVFGLGLLLLALSACSEPAAPVEETVDQAAAETVQGSFHGKLGLQLYSLRADFAKDVPGTLAKVRDYGIELVELAGTYQYTPAEFKNLLDQYGLRAVAGHFPYERLRDDVEGLAQDAITLGLQYVGVASIPHRGGFDEQTAREAVKLFNTQGEALAKHGLKFYYHQHGFEFVPYENGTLMDLLIRETNPEHVSFQMDLLWTVFPGQDPVVWLQKYPDRWRLMHLKDLNKGVKVPSTLEEFKPGYDVVLGTGQVDMPAVLRVAQEIGIEYYFIEDEAPEAADRIPQSLRYLQQVRF
ncbi:MAG TPA: sugar phosphate isomerase/epimerase [Acidobacteriota bacterium]|nr:sugar phosphate isomerase/epimerase [Acidobacteriota bacterium]